MTTGTVDKQIVCAFSILQNTNISPLHHKHPFSRVCLQWPIGSDVVGIDATHVTVNAKELKPGCESVHLISVTPIYNKQTKETKEKRTNPLHSASSALLVLGFDCCCSNYPPGYPLQGTG